VIASVPKRRWTAADKLGADAADEGDQAQTDRGNVDLGDVVLDGSHRRAGDVLRRPGADASGPVSVASHRTHVGSQPLSMRRSHCGGIIESRTLLAWLRNGGKRAHAGDRIDAIQEIAGADFNELSTDVPGHP